MATTSTLSMSAHRKYTPEQIEAEIARPKKKGGRPRKYATEEERKRAFAAANRRAYWRKKNEDVAANQFPLQRRILQTDEERRQAHAESNRKYMASHQEQHRICAMATYYRARIELP